ncbi:hypothetical protein AAF712_012067 [Marasmius tenuissimus]|uniref:GmrSD restriction endonucleases N-terminal domain-containing protein n=1 Tax=Marasmius tenuissimus TaxID=585030 RepID=A0ABR2ZIV1_9AGAR
MKATTSSSKLKSRAQQPAKMVYFEDNESDLTDLEDEDEEGELEASPQPIAAPVQPRPSAPEPLRPSTRTAEGASQWKRFATPALPKMRTANYSTEMFPKWIQKELLDLDPEYQRDVVWTDQKQSGLIDSLLNNYYIPPVIFCVKTDSMNREIRTCIDGKQRLTSIRRFMDGELAREVVKSLFNSAISLTYLLLVDKDPKTGRKTYYDAKKIKGRKEMAEQDKSRFQTHQIQCVEYDNLTEDQEREMFAAFDGFVSMLEATMRIFGRTLKTYKDLVKFVRNQVKKCVGNVAPDGDPELDVPAFEYSKRNQEKILEKMGTQSTETKAVVKAEPQGPKPSKAKAKAKANRDEDVEMELEEGNCRRRRSLAPSYPSVDYLSYPAPQTTAESFSSSSIPRNSPSDRKSGAFGVPSGTKQEERERLGGIRRLRNESTSPMNVQAPAPAPAPPVAVAPSRDPRILQKQKQAAASASTWQSPTVHPPGQTLYLMLKGGIIPLGSTTPPGSDGSAGPKRQSIISAARTSSPSTSTSNNHPIETVPSASIAPASAGLPARPDSLLLSALTHQRSIDVAATSSKGYPSLRPPQDILSIATVIISLLLLSHQLIDPLPVGLGQEVEDVGEAGQPTVIAPIPAVITIEDIGSVKSSAPNLSTERGRGRQPANHIIGEARADGSHSRTRDESPAAHPSSSTSK